MCYNIPMTTDPYLEKMWKEKEEVDHPKEETDDNFIPAKETRMDANNSIVHVEL